MKSLLMGALLLLSFASLAQQVEVNFERICAFPQEDVEKQEFWIASDSGQLLTSYSSTISVTPDHCKKAEVLSKYKIVLPLYDIGDPLRLQLAEQFFLKVIKLDQNKIFIGDQNQLKRVAQIQDIKAQTILTSDLIMEDRVLTLQNKYEEVKLRFHYLAPAK